MDVFSAAMQQGGQPGQSHGDSAGSTHAGFAAIYLEYLAHVGQPCVEKRYFLRGGTLLGPENMCGTLGAGGRCGDIGQQDPLDSCSGDVEQGGVDMVQVDQSLPTLAQRVTGLVAQDSSECD